MPRERRERIHGPYKHGNQWRIVTVRADGSRHVESCESENEARGIVAAARQQSEGRTIAHAVDAYEVAMRDRKLESVTISRSRAHLDKLLDVNANGHRFVRWLTPKRAADRYATSRVGLAVDTQRNALAAGRSFGRFCAERGWLPADPFGAVKAIGRRKRGKPQLHLDETRKLIDACIAEGSRAAAAVATSVLLGCSASEVTQRQVRDLDDGGRVLHVTKGKNRYRVRSLEVPDMLRGLLLELAGERPGAAPLFGDGDLDRPSRYWIHYHCQRLCKAAKVPVVSPHGLRGTHTTLAIGAVSTSHSVAAAIAAAGASAGHAPGSPITASTYAAPGAVTKATGMAALRAIQGGKR